RLEHPAIPPVHELSSDADGRPFFVMKKLGGVTLDKVLRDPATYREHTRTRLLHAFVDVGSAIQLAHDRNIIHRDRRRSTVLLGEHGEVYVLDWGIACELDRCEQPGAAGTPGYMAPEQETAQPDLDARVDVYGLGCILYEILYGPRSTRRTPTPTRDVPPELESLCRWATNSEREDRLG